jgi:rod shape-determining protein MreC
MATPLFRQGARPSAKLFLYSVVCVCLIAIDSRVKLLEPAREVISWALYPVQQFMLLPRTVSDYVSSWIENQEDLSTRAHKSEREAALMASRSQQYLGLKAENAQLRQLLALRSRQDLSTVAADILYETHEPIIRKVIIDRGSYHHIAPGMPVMDSQGLLGQITRVFPLVAEVNLIIDKDQATPVQIVRNGLRALAYGGIEGGMLELRFMAGNADIKEGDELHTSGIDGVYPADLPVAKVLKIDRSSAFGFAHILCEPLAGVMRNRQVAIITSKPVFPSAPDTADKKALKHKDKPTSAISAANQNNVLLPFAAPIATPSNVPSALDTFATTPTH